MKITTQGVCDEIRKYMKDEKLAMYVVENAAGIRSRKLSDILRGRTALRMDEYIDICAALEVSPSYFVDMAMYAVEGSIEK